MKILIDKSDKNKQYVYNYIISVNEYKIKFAGFPTPWDLRNGGH